MKGVVAVVGLVREAAILRRAFPDIAILIGGGQQGRLAADLNQSVREAGAVLSFGLCGALDSALKAGALVIATEVIWAGGRIGADAAWTAALAKALPGAHLATIAGADAIAATVAAKTALRASTGAAAVDMESGLAAEAAARAGLPFAAVRAVSDAADRGLPPAAEAAFRADGGVDLGALLLSLAARPIQIPALMRLGRDAGAAFGALEETAPHLVSKF